MRCLAALIGWVFLLGAAGAQGPAPATTTQAKIKVLFLGDKGHHQPELRFKQIEAVLAGRAIDVVYTGSANALNAETLAKFDAWLIYPNIHKSTPTHHTP